MLEVISPQQLVKARKKHYCSYCDGEINIGDTYERSTLKYDDLYVWKSHLQCTKIANELNMFEDCDDGLTGDDFQEAIHEFYCDLIRKQDEEFYESVRFKYPPFQEQLDYVCNHYLNENP